ncbi:uncharacterized protein ASCRUDRAFT_76883 [Ascoidea rubescens DSM 1968]|uniref:Uncharacterized protein n=1 Tax=Ascoidea rubescens DSM 1968 TaxID=1344418 RepID=A0A1D2VEB7_9ASCO|nr:hypothetical protein ASCRUDRAFT_76883 [Ascoidea rubescens DSM 1968]ODV59965.1 hypothetical protein ASCRUDRAFT_76883 [Ascoidea rubescens DSM 1968]
MALLDNDFARSENTQKVVALADVTGINDILKLLGKIFSLIFSYLAHTYQICKLSIDQQIAALPSNLSAFAFHFRHNPIKDTILILLCLALIPLSIKPVSYVLYSFGISFGILFAAVTVFILFVIVVFVPLIFISCLLTMIGCFVYNKWYGEKDKKIILGINRHTVI